MNNSIHKSDGLKDLEDLMKTLLSTSVNSNHPFGINILNNLIFKVDIIIKKIQYNPRLPFYQIEKSIIDSCRIDDTINGVIIEILFSKRNECPADPRLAYLKVKL